MLNGVSIYREAVHPVVRKVAVLTREDVAEARPAARRGFHVAVGGSLDVREPPATADAGRQGHGSSFGGVRYRGFDLKDCGGNGLVIGM